MAKKNDSNSAVKPAANPEGRPRAKVQRTNKKGDPLAPVVSGVIELDEREKLDAIVTLRGRSASRVVRWAILRFIRDDSLGKVDWAFGEETHAVQLRKEIGLPEETPTAERERKAKA